MVYNHAIIKRFPKNNQEKDIFETGTARGFSSIIMSYVKKLKREYVIHTIDLIPQ